MDFYDYGAFLYDSGFHNSVNSGHYEEEAAVDIFQGHDWANIDAIQLTQKAVPNRDDRFTIDENDLGNRNPTLESSEPTFLPPSDGYPVEVADLEHTPFRRKRQRGGIPTSPTSHLPQPVAYGGLDRSYVEVLDVDEERYEEGETAFMAERRAVSQIPRKARMQFDESYSSSRYKGTTRQIHNQLHWKDPISNIWRRFAPILALASL